VLLLVAQGRSTLEPRLCPVDLTALKTFASTMGPLSVTYICKNLCYILLQTAAASLSMVQLAAHQVGCQGLSALAGFAFVCARPFTRI
jgi:hypothetical protein